MLRTERRVKVRWRTLRIRSVLACYVSIKSRLCLADMDANQVIILRICPESVDMCTVKLTCEPGTVSEQVISMLRGVKGASEVSKLRLTLKEPGDAARAHSKKSWQRR